MKKYLVLLFLLIPSLCFAVDAASIMGKSADPSGTNNVDKVNGLTWGTASGNATKINGVNAAAAGSKSCPTDETLLVNYSGLNADFYSVGYDATTVYVGQGSYQPAANYTICAVSVRFRGHAGTPADYQIEIFNMSGVNLGTAPTGDCVSDSKTVPDTNNNIIKFTGMSCSLSSSSTYGITVTKTTHDYSSTNYATLYAGAATSWSGSEMEWGADKNRADDNSVDVSMDIYGF